MTRSLPIAAALVLLAHCAIAQLSFTNASQSLNADFNSGGVMGVSDMDGDGLDDIIHMNASEQLLISYQNADGSFTLVDYGDVSGSNQWGMAIGDLDNDGHNDVFSGGSYDGVHVVMISSPGNSSMYSPAQDNMFMQACNMVDIDNDGWLDAFACHDDAESRIWGNDGMGGLVPQNGWIDMATVPGSDNSGNYGSVWSDFDNDGDLDLYIAKCRQGVSNPNDPRRINALYVNDGNGNFTEQADERGLVVFSQSWTADFADIDNDGDFDCLITNHDNTLNLLENDGNGFFTDITAGSGLEVTGFFLQAILKDFDNDGFVDLIYAGGTHAYMKGNGDGTFTPQPGMFPYSNTMHSFAIGDLNNDGFLDVYSSYGNGYVSPDFSNDDILWLNDGNDNNYFVVNLEGTVSNADAVGARVEIFGPWGMQTREVRAGESYGINNTFQVHFGLGQSETIDSLVIDWPAGGVQVIENPLVNQTLSVIENTCVADPAFVSTDGPPVLCEGSTLTLTASAGESYLWSNGETSQSIEVDATGGYSVTVFSEGGCFSNSPTFMVELEPDETPEIFVAGELEFCEGNAVTLTSSEAQGYTWSSGEETQSIDVTESGTYSVTVEGACDNFTSSEVTVVVNDTPDAPMAEGDVIPAPGVAELTAVGDNLRWYDVPEGGEILGEGPSFQTPFIDVTTSFWVEDANLLGGELFNGGKEDNSGNGGIHTNSTYYLLFDAAEDMIIKSVKVYAEDDGNRVIQVIDAAEQVVAEGTYFVPDGESVVELNLEVPAGTGYGLRSGDSNPQLYRNSNGSNLQYPYSLGELGAITGTNIEGSNEFNFYYFFYDWEVQRPISGCISDRTEAVAVIDTATSLEENEAAGFNVFPVPADDFLNVQFGFNGPYELTLFDLAGKVHHSAVNTATQGQVTTIATADLATGLYLLRVVSDGHAKTQKVVVK